MDECSSALDNETENFVMNEISNYFKDKTIISVTHSKNELDRYHEIINLDPK